MGTSLKPVAHSFDTDHKMDYGQLVRYLGGKGANLNIMKRELGLPVPPGFTIPTVFNEKYLKKQKLTPVMDREVRARVSEIEKEKGRGFGNPDRPLLLSVRSGAPTSMPGMMDTVLNLGLNETTVRGLAKFSNELFALDCYRRFLHMFGTTVRGFSDSYYTPRYDAYCKLFSLATDEYKAKGLRNLIKTYRMIIDDIPIDPYVQLGETTIAVFKSWNSPRAIAYREHQGIDHNTGTAVTVQMMVFGNLNDNSGTGVLFSRNPNTGENKPYCNYLRNAQGEDVVAGTHKTMGIEELAQDHPGCCKELLNYASDVLEPYFRDMVDIEFTIEDGELYILQVRRGVGHPDATRKILMDLLDEGKITPREFEDRMAKVEKPKPPKKKPKMKYQVLVGQGKGSSPGIVWGQALLNPKNPKKLKDYILVRRFTEPNDYPIMTPAAGIATAEGGTVSHAALIARTLGKPCVVGAGFAITNETALMPSGYVVNEGDLIGIDGTTGEIFVEGSNGSAQQKV